jgi:hypothetical protein
MQKSLSDPKSENRPTGCFCAVLSIVIEPTATRVFVMIIFVRKSKRPQPGRECFRPSFVIGIDWDVELTCHVHVLCRKHESGMTCHSSIWDEDWLMAKTFALNVICS